MSAEDERTRRYAIRALPRAERDITANTSRLADIARAWYDGLFALAATLAQNPRRFAVVSEGKRFSQEVRQVLYRRTPGGPAWRVLFTISENPEDAPTVNLLHIRHGAQRRITRAEAGQTEAQQ